MKKISREQFLKAVDVIIQFEAQLVEDGARIAEDIKVARKYARRVNYTNHNITPETQFLETNASVRLINLIKCNEEHFGVDFNLITVRILSEFPLTTMMTWRGFGKKIVAELSSIIISTGLEPRQ